jgi:hypothetical protein
MLDRVTPAQLASAWLADVKDRALSRARAEAVAEGTQFSAEQLELIEIGIVAGVSEMLDLSLNLDATDGTVPA